MAGEWREFGGARGAAAVLAVRAAHGTAVGGRVEAGGMAGGSFLPLFILRETP